MTPSSNDHETERKIEVRAVFTFLIVLAILALAIIGAIFMIVNKRVAKQEEKERPVPGVEIMIVEIGDHPVKITTQGVIESRREATLTAEVSGRVLGISPNLKRGGIVKQGERLAWLDNADYQSALASAQSTLADAELALAQEQARVEQARLDWEKLGRGASGNPLVLREPQLASAQAKAASARAAVDQAKRNVERTEITAPFDAGIREASIEIGSVAGPGQTITRLFSNNDLEIRLPLTLEDFGFLQRDPAGKLTGSIRLSATIGGNLIEWPAEPVRIDQEIDRATLSAQLIAKVLPGSNKDFPLPPVGLFVQCEIQGATLTNVAEIPRRAIREGGQVLLVTPQNQLEFRDLTTVRTTRTTAIVHEGLTTGERLCLTRLNNPVNGMPVRVNETIDPPSIKKQ